MVFILGLGIARILYLDKTIDVFTTHLVSYTKVILSSYKLLKVAAAF